MPIADSTNRPPSQTKGSSVSARKLAATLWEINLLPSPNDLDLRNRGKAAKFRHLENGHNRRSASVLAQKYQLTDYIMGERLEPVSNSSLMEIEAHTNGKSHRECRIGIKSRLKDVSNGLTASKELLRVLNRIWGIYEQTSSPGMSLVTALAVELHRASIQVNQLIKVQPWNRNDMDYLKKRFEEEKAAWKSKQRERIRNAIACIAEELQVEKKLRRQTERLNKKLGKELADTKKSLYEALKELESEKRAKDILEQMCNELARGIGEDRAQVEELKKESAKVREEVEKEREMLQLADVLRKERVQMKLSEAKYHFEEKNAAVERLRNELEAYLRETRVVAGSPNYGRIKELEAYLKQIQDGSCQRSQRQINHDDDDSVDSDFHSIELNMDNKSMRYKWSYACDGDVADNTKRESMDRDFKGRKSVSENIQWGSICLQRNADASNWDFISKKAKHPDVLAWETDSHTRPEDRENQIMQWRCVKSSRDRILCGAKRQPMQNSDGPTRQGDAASAVSSDTSPVLSGDSLKTRLIGAKGERRNLPT